MLILYLNNVSIMDPEGIVIRIKTPAGDMDSSVDSPSLLNFNDLLVSLPQSQLSLQSSLMVAFFLERRHLCSLNSRVWVYVCYTEQLNITKL